MKSLVESLFDGDLVSKDTGLEYIYGLVEHAWVSSSYYIPFFNERKIKHEFNELSKKFEMQQWNVNKFCGMDRYQNMDTDEMLRELLYIIVTKVKSTCIKNPNTLRNAIVKVIDEYADLKPPYYLDITINKNNKIDSSYYIYIWFCEDSETEEGRALKRLGRIELRLRQL